MLGVSGPLPARGPGQAAPRRTEPYRHVRQKPVDRERASFSEDNPTHEAGESPSHTGLKNLDGSGELSRVD
jgi:hypothetical protein